MVAVCSGAGEAVTPGPNLSQSAWQTALEPHDPELARQLEENTNPYAVAAGLGLAVPEYVRFGTVGEFMADPEAGMEPLLRRGIANFYVGARTTAQGLSNFRNERDRLGADEIVPFIEDRLSPDLYDKYNLRIAEFLFGVCVVATINRSGTISLDIARGTLPPLTSGLITPEFTASNALTEKNRSGVLLYYDESERDEPRVPLPSDEASVLNTVVRTAIWGGIKQIPVVDGESDIRKVRLAGTYEFAVVDHGGLQVPVFADAQVIRKGNRGTEIPE